MKASDLVEILIQADEPQCARDLIEASVHLPKRGSKYVASYRGETGRRVWRTTGLRNRAAALAQARKWEIEAQRKRPFQGPVPRKPTIRVRAGSGEEAVGLLSQKEVAMIMKISERAVREIERGAFEKLRQHPALKEFWQEWITGEVEEAASESEWTLTRAEVAAVYALARTPAERNALTKLLALASASPWTASQ
jgi:hypothetical protein